MSIDKRCVYMYCVW